MFRVTLALICALILVVPLCSRESVAAPINGFLQLPPKFTAGSRHNIRGFCERQSNEVRGIQAPLRDPRAEMLVALEGAGLPRDPAARPTLVMEDARFSPPVVGTRPGDKVIFRNSDSTVHILEPSGAAAKKGEKFMKPMRIQSGSETTHTFTKTGDFQLRCSEVPHMQATVIVKENALFQVPDATGAFRFAEVPAGTYTMSIWYRGKWVVKNSVTVKKAKGKFSMKVQLPSTLSKD